MFQFANEESHTVWIGLKKISGKWYWSNGQEVKNSLTDWAENQPDSLGSCVIADKGLGYKWRTTNCAEPHAFYCALRIPDCPFGFKYELTISQADGQESDSCYKTTDIGGFKFEDTKL